MKLSSLIFILATANLTACGGGGNESGPPEEITASPSQFTVKGTGAGCASGMGPTVFVHGGQPPYKLFNTLPTAMRLSTSTVQQSGQSFNVRLTGQCFDAAPIRIEDAMGRLSEVVLSNQPGTP